MPGNNKFKKTTKSNTKQSIQIAKNVKAIKRLRKQPELKVKASFRSWALSVIGVQQFPLDGLLRGVADGQRIGDQVTWKFSTLNFSATPAGVGNTVFRMLIFMDRQNNNSVIVTPVGNILTHTVTNIQACNSTYNDEFVGKGKRYKILFDTKMHIMSNIQGTVNYQRTVNNRLGHVTHYSTNIGTPADIIDKCISIYFIANDANLNWQMSSKMLYIDS